MNSSSRIRSVRLLLALGVLVTLGVGSFYLLRPTPGATRENFRRLHKGMSPEEVEAILGSRGEVFEFMSFVGGAEEMGMWGEDWRGIPNIYICVQFKDGEAVSGCSRLIDLDRQEEIEETRERLRDAPPGVLALIRNWLARCFGP